MKRQRDHVDSQASNGMETKKSRQRPLFSIFDRSSEYRIYFLGDTDIQYFSQLRRIVDFLLCFRDADECMLNLSGSDCTTILLILSRSVLSSLQMDLDVLTLMPQIHSVYIFNDEMSSKEGSKIGSCHEKVSKRTTNAFLIEFIEILRFLSRSKVSILISRFCGLPSHVILYI